MSSTAYLSIHTEFIHGGHIAIIEKATGLGTLTGGVLSDEKKILINSRAYETDKICMPLADIMESL